MLGIEGAIRESRRQGNAHAAALHERLADQQAQHEAALDAQRKDYEKKLAELETLKTVSLQRALEARYDQSSAYRHPMVSQASITEHCVGVFNPAGQPARRVRMHLVRMDPYPRNILQPQYQPTIPYAVPLQSGGDPSVGLTIGPGQEEYWIIGYTLTGGGDGTMYAGGFAVSDQRWHGLPWQVDPDERWRLSYEIVCDGMPDVKFSIVVGTEEDSLTLRLEG